MIWNLKSEHSSLHKALSLILWTFMLDSKGQVLTSNDRIEVMKVQNDK